MVLLVLLPGALIEPSRAQTVHITVGQSSITISMNLLFQENLTSLPLINVHITQSNSSIILPLIADAIEKLVPSAHVASLELNAKTSNSSARWSLEENYSITVTGINTNSGSNIRSNLEFLAMNISQSIDVSSWELNAVGSAYLLAPLNATNPGTTAYYIDGHQTLSAVIPTVTTKTFWLLDLTWVPPISSWPETQNLLKQTTVWSLDPGAPRYNLTLGTKSPEGPLIGAHEATYYPTFSISVPSNAWIDKNTISFDVATPFEGVMPFLVAVSLAALIIVSFVDRRLTGALRARKRK